MIAWSSDGWWSAGMVMIMWGLSDNRHDLTICGLLLVGAAFFPALSDGRNEH
jgi:hypothetical protein